MGSIILFHFYDKLLVEFRYTTRIYSILIRIQFRWILKLLWPQFLGRAGIGLWIFWWCITFLWTHWNITQSILSFTIRSGFSFNFRREYKAITIIWVFWDNGVSYWTFSTRNLSVGRATSSTRSDFSLIRFTFL